MGRQRTDGHRRELSDDIVHVGRVRQDAPHVDDALVGQRDHAVLTLFQCAEQASLTGITGVGEGRVRVGARCRLGLGPTNRDGHRAGPWFIALGPYENLRVADLRRHRPRAGRIVDPDHVDSRTITHAGQASRGVLIHSLRHNYAEAHKATGCNVGRLHARAILA